MIPEFNKDGNLPEGLYTVGEAEFFESFCSKYARRKWFGERFQEFLVLVKSTAQLDRLFVWGSFVSSKESPNDIDVLMVMKETFDLEKVSGDNEVIFDHTAARIRFHMDIFWSKANIGEEVLRLWLETYQITKDFKRRGILEVILT